MGGSLVSNLKKAAAGDLDLMRKACPRSVVSVVMNRSGSERGELLFPGTHLVVSFKPDGYRSNHSQFLDVGRDLGECLARVMNSENSEMGAKLTEASREAGSNAFMPQVNEYLAEFAAFAGGAAWKMEVLPSMRKMQDCCEAERPYMKGLLLEHLAYMLEHGIRNIKRTSSESSLAEAVPTRTIVFEIVDEDDMPRRMLGTLQAALKNGKLHFVGPVGYFYSGMAGASDIGNDFSDAIFAADSSASGPSPAEQRQAKLNEQMGAIAGSSSRTGGAGGKCNLCKGQGHRTCTLCHGKGCRGNVGCKGSGKANAKCTSCKGTGRK